MQTLKFKPISPDTVASANPVGAAGISWREIKTGATFSFYSRTGGPGWSGADFVMYFRNQPIEISASWATPLGEYSARISFISLPESLFSEREIIQSLVIEGVITFCAEDYDKDFSPKPFACTVNLNNTIWKTI